MTGDLHAMFSRAAKTGAAVRLLRLACHRTFREEIMHPPQRGTVSRAVALLQDVRLPEIEMVLSNPYSVPFLERMDRESKDNEDIGRVQSEVLQFARGILRVNAFREQIGLDPIHLAFHSEPLIWNLCILGQEAVIVRSYFGPHTGHDGSVEEQSFAFGLPTRLGESFASYYEAVRGASETRTVVREGDLDQLGPLPSLFKPNAISRTEAGDAPRAAKRLASRPARDAEDEWLGKGSLILGRARRFRPRPQATGDGPSLRAGWQANEVRWLDGMTVERFVAVLRRLANRDPGGETARLAREAGSLVVRQGFEALAEFHCTWAELGVPPRPTSISGHPYPWKENVVAALRDAARHLSIPRSLVAEAWNELEPVIGALEAPAASCVPFRDAHLKNRFLELGPEAVADPEEAILAFLTRAQASGLDAALAARTWDFDFETTHRGTTPWDDPLHLLWCSHIGFAQSSDRAALGLEACDPVRILADWWRAPACDDDLRLMLANLLARSLREFARRAWYAAVMPVTYARRYGQERPTRFATLASTASSQLHLEATHRVVDRLRQRFGNLVPQTVDPPEALLRVDPIPSARATVFISYAREDVETVERLGRALASHGYHPIVDQTEIRQGNFKDRIVAAVEGADLVLVFLTRKSLASKWIPKEVSIAKDLEKRILPVYWNQRIPPEEIREAKASLYFDLQGDSLHHVVLTEAGWDEGIRAVLRALEAE